MEIAELISTIGFPIVAYLLIYKQMQEQDKRHAEEVEKIREALDNNTKAIVELVTMARDRRGDNGPT